MDAIPNEPVWYTTIIMIMADIHTDQHRCYWRQPIVNGWCNRHTLSTQRLHSECQRWWCHHNSNTWWLRCCWTYAGCKACQSCRLNCVPATGGFRACTPRISPPGTNDTGNVSILHEHTVTETVDFLNSDNFDTTSTAGWLAYKVSRIKVIRQDRCQWTADMEQFAAWTQIPGYDLALLYQRKYSGQCCRTTLIPHF